jgi:methylated-DNA-[protein]-cysteine S-methyltransferase
VRLPGVNEQNRSVHAVVDTPIGALTLVGDGHALSGLYFPDHARHPGAGTFGPRDDRAFVAARTQLAEYFAGERTEFDLPLAPHGNEFQRSVWRLLGTIPYGRTRSYGQLAAQLGDPGLARAVGAANGRNPISIVVPCHRVVGHNGSLTGYAGGLARKAFLLELEQPTAARVPTLF